MEFIMSNFQFSVWGIKYGRNEEKNGLCARDALLDMEKRGQRNLLLNNT
jgi:hypothetical protein